MRGWPFVLLLALAGCGDSAMDRSNGTEIEQGAAEVDAQVVSFAAGNRVTVFGTYRPTPNPRALIVLFHQGGANRAEYRDIAPRLVAAGFATLSIDQRSGGTMFGAANRTVAALGTSTSYDEALPDLVAALGWAQSKGGPVVVAGSSYSAALATLLAAEHPELVGVLLFSPGEYLEDDGAVMRAAAELRMPVFATSGPEADERADARRLVATAPTTAKALYEPRGGAAHGASILSQARNPAGSEGAWEALTTFLDRVVPGTGARPAR